MQSPRKRKTVTKRVKKKKTPVKKKTTKKKPVKRKAAKKKLTKKKFIRPNTIDSPADNKLLMREKFKQYFIYGTSAGSIRGSGLRAGYGMRYAETIGHQKWFNEFVKYATAEIEKKTGLTLRYFINELKKLAEDPDTPVHNKIQALGRGGYLFAMKDKMKLDEDMAKLLPNYTIHILPAEAVQGPHLRLVDEPATRQINSHADVPIELISKDGKVITHQTPVHTGGVLDLISNDGGDGDLSGRN